VDSIKPGESYVDALRTGIEHATAVLVLIGPEWLASSPDPGGRRLDDPTDSVRQEVELSLELGKRVLPVLINGASLPSPTDLPSSLAGLSRRNALSLSNETFTADADRLLGVLKDLRFSASVSA
jgi:hypothetical protein